jgi:hypothetical protein
MTLFSPPKGSAHRKTDQSHGDERHDASDHSGYSAGSPPAQLVRDKRRREGQSKDDA